MDATTTATIAATVWRIIMALLTIDTIRLTAAWLTAPPGDDDTDTGRRLDLAAALMAAWAAIPLILILQAILAATTR